MALANSSVNVTPGAGVAIATELGGSKHYEAWTDADALGHVAGARDTWCLSEEHTTALFSFAPSGTLPLCALWNGAGSGVTLEVLHYSCSHYMTVAANFNPGAAFVHGYRLTAAPSAGTARTPVKLKSASSALPAQVLGYGQGVTAVKTGSPLFSFAIGLKGADSMAMGDHPFGALPGWSLAALYGSEPIVLAEGEGLFVEHDFNNDTPAPGIQRLLFRVR